MPPAHAATRLRPVAPTTTAHLFRPLSGELVALLRSLSSASWDLPTAAGSWLVRDVVAHLLHGDLRELSSSRTMPPDRVATRPVPFRQIVDAIDIDNARGVEFLRGFSGELLTDLIHFTGPRVAKLFRSLAPDGTAAANVAWAGEDVSVNWTDVGREFTERWHHQMQIRDAVGAPGLRERRWIVPVLRLSVLSLQRSFAFIDAPVGTSVVLVVHEPWSHAWTIVRATEAWRLFDGYESDPSAVVTMDCETAWRGLYDFYTPAEARSHVEIRGNAALAEPILSARSVMIREAMHGE
jgi:hypothetical protein